MASSWAFTLYLASTLAWKGAAITLLAWKIKELEKTMINVLIRGSKSIKKLNRVINRTDRKPPINFSLKLVVLICIGIQLR